MIAPSALALLGATVLACVATIGPEQQHAKATVAVESRTSRAGGTAWVGLRLRLPRPWHVYWTNPGDSGLPIAIRVEGDGVVEVGEPRWPAPSRFVSGPLASYGYAGDVLIALPLTLAPDLAPGPLDLRLHADWLACHDDEGCFQEQVDLELRIDVALDAPAPGSDAPLFAAARAAWPIDARAWPQTLSVGDDALVLRVEFPPPVDAPSQEPSQAPSHGAPRDLAAHEPLFFPHEGGLIQAAADPTARVDGRWLELRMVRPPLRTGVAPPTELGGVLVLKPRAGGRNLAFELHARAGG